MTQVPHEKINTFEDVQRPSVDWTRSIERISGGEAIVLPASHDKSIINIAHRLPGAIGWLVFNGSHERACHLFQNKTDSHNKSQSYDFPLAPHIMAKGKPYCFRNTWGSDSASHAARFAIDSTRAADAVAKRDGDLPPFGKVVDLSPLPENQVQDNATAQSAEAAIDWDGQVQIAHHREDDWEDFVVIVDNEDHVYGHPADEDKTYAGMWHFSEWRFRNRPQEPKRVVSYVNVYANGESFGYPTQDRADRSAKGNRVARYTIDVPEGHGL